MAFFGSGTKNVVSYIKFHLQFYLSDSKIIKPKFNMSSAKKIQKQISPLRESASMILFENPSVPSNLLMLRRIAKISFGNAVVFPGGACDKEDKEFTKKYIQRERFQDYSKISAIRQLVEETGILLLPQRNQKLIEQLEDKSLTRETLEYEFLCNLWKDHLHLIVPLIRLLTVQFVPGKRFDTIFYTHHPEVIRINLSKINQNKTSELQNLNEIVVSGEAQGYFWESPENLLEKYRKEDILLVPPQIIILNCLRNLKTCQQFSNLDAEACFEPVMFHTNNMRNFTLFGDHEYKMEHIIKKEPESESRTNLIAYYAKKSNQEGKDSPIQSLRRCQIDMKTKSFMFKSHFTEKSILGFLQTTPQL